MKQNNLNQWDLFFMQCESTCRVINSMVKDSTIHSTTDEEAVRRVSSDIERRVNNGEHSDEFKNIYR